jgi:hypothetical protein
VKTGFEIYFIKSTCCIELPAGKESDFGLPIPLKVYTGGENSLEISYPNGIKRAKVRKMS